MAVSKYAGAWARRRDPATNPNLGAGVDTRHLTPVEESPAVPNPPHGLPTPAVVLYAQDDWMAPAAGVMLAGTPVLDNSPADWTGSHFAGEAPRGNEAPSHMIDEGGPARAHYYTPPIIREADAQYVTERLEMNVQVAQSRGQLVQGIDRDGVSPQGMYVNRWIHRRVPRRTITPDAYPWFPYRAAIAKQSPALPDGQGNQYRSPYDKIIQVYKKRVVTPQTRRQPPAFGDQETTDGTDAIDPGFWSF